MIEPGSTEHRRLISPSKVAAILGLSRWESAYRLWHRMKGLVPDEPDSDVFAAGHAYEPALAYLWCRENPGWQLSPGEVQVRADLGFPAVATLDRRGRRGRARRVVQFKTARDLSDWGDYFTDLDSAPADYAVQVLAEMHISGYTRLPAHLMVMGPYFRWHTYVIPYDPVVCMHIEQRCQQFWDSLQADDPPPLDDSTATYEAVRELHPDIDGSTAVIDPALAADWLDADRAEKDAKKRLTGLKTRVLEQMGNAQRGIASGLLAGVPNELKVARRQPSSRGSVSLYPETKTSTTDLRGLAK
ncbi:YqaJ viral recombinase family protein [Skermania piniformis]|uniref:YqaJ viral recombinase domain-containing protein n=1 Tax=Skermania pinensis TaxID=39122 RepID=A0ABX8SAI8_9ACTN|nr:YqaJ viral recombinase family protein [Skermania piniformis]QXQ14875.1 hypothetical protein KV203_05690 [Skermania piniformis]